MEVGVRVESENLLTGERKHTASAYLTFVALDEEGRAKVVPPIVPESEAAKLRYEEAKVRREQRLLLAEARRRLATDFQSETPGKLGP